MGIVRYNGRRRKVILVWKEQKILKEKKKARWFVGRRGEKEILLTDSHIREVLGGWLL